MSGMQLAEHEYLQSVSATSTNPCDTPESEVLSSCPHMPDALNSVDGPLPQPEQPDPHLLQRLRVRVGVNSSWPLADAVKKVRYIGRYMGTTQYSQLC